MKMKHIRSSVEKEKKRIMRIMRIYLTNGSEMTSLLSSLKV